jgi:phosphopantothenoylcysteine decarboxylase/phosphopantothenate--cysteine ligase
VADYHPATAETRKIKKSASNMSIDLVRSPDILASVAKLENGPFTVGFAAETNNLREYATGKLEDKKLHMIVANKVGNNEGFDVDANAVDVYWRDGERSFALAAKSQLAHNLMRLIAERYHSSFASATKRELPATAVRD